MSGSRRTTLHVFISSPGDCAQERALMREVVHRVSGSDAARAADVELKPLLWEDLPPGPAEPGDLQSRVNRLLDRYGLERYEVYAGAMKDRLGTPTAKFRSGTIEELETALAGHRRAQVPAEVLFYFLESQAPEVAAFREELSRRGFLFAVVRDREELERRFTEHLTRIVTEWRLWRNRMRRGLRSARSAAAFAAAILLLVAVAAYFRFDRGGADRIEKALQTGGAAAALAVYEREAPYLLAHKAFTRRELRRQIVQTLRKETIEDSTALSAVSLWQRAHRVGIWSDDDEDARRLLRRIAARRLLETLVADGIGVAEWPQRCRPFELKALRELAHEVVSSDALAAWPRDHRTAICVIGEAWSRLAAFAADDAEAKVVLVRLAPPEVAAGWVRASVTRATGDPEVHDIVLAAEQRREPAIVSALLEHLQEGRIDPAVHRDDLLRAMDALDARHVAHHLSRIAQGHGKVPELYPSLLAKASIGSLPQAYLDRLVEPVIAGGASSEYEIAAYRAIAHLRDARARTFLLRRYEEYASERTSFGFQQKAALVDALSATGVIDAADRGLRLARIARREAEVTGANEWIVQAAYLHALAGNAAAWPRHAVYVRELFGRRQTADTMSFPDGFEDAAVDLLGKLTAAQIVELLALPPGTVSDEIEGKWEPRWYILRALGQSQTLEGDAVANEVLGRLPIDDDLRLRVVRALARSGRNVTRTFLAREYVRDPRRNAGYLGVLADLGAEPFFLEQIAAGANEAVLDAAARLSGDAARCRVFARATQRLADAHARWLWNEAGRCRIVDDALIDAAVRELRNGSHAADVAAMKYLAAVEREQQIVPDATKVLRAAAPFEWFALAQAMPWRVTREASVETLLGERALLLVTDSAEPGSFIAGGRGVWNPLLALYGRREDAAAVQRLLEWSQSAKPVEVLGNAPDASVLYRAYCLWLAAPWARQLAPSAIAGAAPLLTENNPSLARAAAAVCLGATG